MKDVIEASQREDEKAIQMGLQDAPVKEPSAKKQSQLSCGKSSSGSSSQPSPTAQVATAVGIDKSPGTPRTPPRKVPCEYGSPGVRSTAGSPSASALKSSGQVWHGAKTSQHQGRLDKIEKQQSPLPKDQGGKEDAEDEQEVPAEHGTPQASPAPGSDGDDMPYDCWGFILQHDHAMKFLKERDGNAQKVKCTEVRNTPNKTRVRGSAVHALVRGTDSKGKSCWVPVVEGDWDGCVKYLSREAYDADFDKHLTPFKDLPDHYKKVDFKKKFLYGWKLKNVKPFEVDGAPVTERMGIPSNRERVNGIGPQSNPTGGDSTAVENLRVRIRLWVMVGIVAPSPPLHLGLWDWGLAHSCPTSGLGQLPDERPLPFAAYVGRTGRPRETGAACLRHGGAHG